MSQYIETLVLLDALDLMMIETLINNRVKELEKLRDDSRTMGVFAMQAEEQLENYGQLKEKILEARNVVKARKAAADAEFYSRLKKRNQKRIVL